MHARTPPLLKCPPSPRPRCYALLAFLFLPPLACHCAVFQIDSSYPFISVNGAPVDWHSGAAAQWALSSRLVRIHPRGIVYAPQGWHLRDLSSIGWTTESCFPSAHGLCQTLSSVMFPSTQTPAVSEARAGECASSQTHRVLTNSTRYDTSSCDVIDRRMDFVHTMDVINYADTSIQQWAFWSICVLGVYLVRCLSRYTLASLRLDAQDAKGSSEANERVPSSLGSFLASSASTLLVVQSGDFMYVTHEDLLFYQFTLFYISAYAALFASVKIFNRLSKVAVSDPPFYNLLAGVLQLIATRLYGGSETPYNPPLIFVIAVRALSKSGHSPSLIRGCTLLLDACMLSLMCCLGFGPDPRYLVALFTGAVAWADLLD